jgi:hypothetical protein
MLQDRGYITNKMRTREVKDCASSMREQRDDDIVLRAAKSRSAGDGIGRH